jgi:hypothetical protein
VVKAKSIVRNDLADHCNEIKHLERATRIELAFSTWEAERVHF